MDLRTLAFAMGSAWLSGINLYATVLTLGTLQRFNVAHLPGDLSYLAHNWVLATAGTLFVVEFIADKIPAVDSVWDLIHTFIRIPAGAVLAATAFAHLDPTIQLVALLLGGGIALSSHSTKAATRLAANTSPEPFSNIFLSLLGDAIAIGGTLLMALHPAVIAGIVLVAVVMSVLLLRWIARVLRGFMERRRTRAQAA